ncbi:MAG: NfeD family protein [Polyangiaceae bacterium]
MARHCTSAVRVTFSLWLLLVAALCSGAAAAADAGVGPPSTLPTIAPVELPALVEPPQGRAAVVLRIEIGGAISNVTAEFVAQAVKEAEQRRAQALLIVMDTPGGLLEATRSIVQAILGAPLPVITYVAPAGARAASAGLFITMASHVAAMHPTSNIGAAHPVSAFGGDIEGTMAEKVTNDTAAWVRSLAQARGRDSAWSEQAVLKSSSITAAEAQAQKVVDLRAPDVARLLTAADGKTVAVRGEPWRVSTAGSELVLFEPSARQRLFAALANPALIYLLLIAGALGLYVEFNSPGLIVPGLVGALCLGVVFGLQSLPLNSFGLLLLGAAAVLLIAELYVTSFGILALLGLGCLVLGSYMLFDVPGSSLRLSPLLIWGTTATVAGFGAFFGYKVLRTMRQGATSGSETYVGRPAEVVQPIVPGKPGKVFFDGTYWSAVSTATLEVGQPCQIEAVEGLLLHVVPRNVA